MSMAYKRFTNSQGLYAMRCNMRIPDIRLGVGYGEDLTPQAMVKEYMPKGKHYVVKPEPETYSYEQLQVNLNSTPLTDESFPSTFYFGELVKGVQ